MDTNEYICIFVASVALTVLFDAPFQNLRKLIMKRPTTKVASVSDAAINSKESIGQSDNNNSSPMAQNEVVSKEKSTHQHPHCD